jgi:hypothetical protein
MNGFNFVRFRSICTLQFKRMNTEEIKERRNKRNEELRQKFTVSSSNRIMPKAGRKTKILRQFRNKLGKSKEEFKKIFDLYNHLISRNNS